MKRQRIVGLAMAAIIAGAGVVMQRDSASAAASGSLLYAFETPNPEPYDDFGMTVATGDVNGDGYADVIAGASREAVGSNAHQGRAYVFSGADGALIYTLTTPGPQSSAYFGTSVAAGDLDGDGDAEIIVGADGANVGGDRTYVFAGADGSLLDTLTAPSPGLRCFGMTVAAGDVDGDGTPDIVVADPCETVDGIEYQGMVYVFSGADRSLLFALTTPNHQYSGFGLALSTGDVDGDGKADIIVGGKFETVDGLAMAGRAYIFSGFDGSLLRTLTAPNPRYLGGFGGSAALGDVNTDGRADAIVASDSAPAAYVFSGADGSLLRTLVRPTPCWGVFGCTTAWDFGSSVTTGDVDGDGTADVIASTYQFDIGTSHTFAFSGADGSLILASPRGGSLAAGDVDADGNADIVAQGHVFAGGPATDSDGDGCSDPWESLTVPALDPLNQWDFYNVPVPALRLDSAGVLDDGIGVTTDIVALLAYSGLTPADADYTADRDANGIADGLQYDRSVSGTTGIAGPPDGGIGITTDVMVMLDQLTYRCGP